MIKYLEKNFLEEVENKKILVDFYANWCGPCKMMNEVFESVEDNIDIDILKIDVDKFPDIARQYNVMSIPTLYLMDNKKIIKNHIGYLNPTELIEFIKK